MRISDLEQETLDLDWFGVDPSGAIARFATGGRGFFPDSVIASKEELMVLTDYFKYELCASCEAQISNNIDSQLKGRLPDKSSKSKQTYLRDYCNIAQKGLYSFDLIDRPVRPTGYFLVARPELPIRIANLPTEIQIILKKTRILVALRDIEVIEKNDVAQEEGFWKRP
jgi:hypothetical protein